MLTEGLLEPIIVSKHLIGINPLKTKIYILQTDQFVPHTEEERSIRKTNWLILYRHTIATNCTNYIKYINTVLAKHGASEY